MPKQSPPQVRYAPAIQLPPYAYVPGHGLPHPVNNPDGHLASRRESSQVPPIAGDTLAALPADPDALRHALAAVLVVNSEWLYAVDLFNSGFYWEAHECWEQFWHALGRTTPAARFTQGLIHLAAAAVKVREGRPAGVTSHTQRARDLMSEIWAVTDDAEASGGRGSLGLTPKSIVAVHAELKSYTPACWHTSRCPAVKVLAAELRVGD